MKQNQSNTLKTIDSKAGLLFEVCKRMEDPAHQPYSIRRRIRTHQNYGSKSNKPLSGNRNIYIYSAW